MFVRKTAERRDVWVFMDVDGFAGGGGGRDDNAKELLPLPALPIPTPGPSRPGSASGAAPLPRGEWAGPALIDGSVGQGQPGQMGSVGQGQLSQADGAPCGLLRCTLQVGSSRDGG